MQILDFFRFLRFFFLLLREETCLPKIDFQTRFSTFFIHFQNTLLLSRMISIPHDPWHDHYDFITSGLLDLAREEILRPLNFWIHIKSMIHGYISYLKFSDGLVAVTLMDYYLIGYPIYTTLFAILPEFFVKVYSYFNRANGFTKRIQFFRDVGVCIFGVSLFSWFYFVLHPRDPLGLTETLISLHFI